MPNFSSLVVSPAFTTSTSSSSFTLPSTTQENAAQSVQQEQLREHFVDEKRYQRPVCNDQQQIGGNPRHTTPTSYEPKSLETNLIETGAYSEDYEDLEPERIEPDKSLQTDLYQFYEIQKRFMEEDHQAPITEEVGEFGKIGDEQSYIQSQMHFDCDSAESVADSDFEDGELRKMLTSPLCAQKATGKLDAIVIKEREVSARYPQAIRKESLRSHSSEGQKASGKPDAMFSSEQETESGVLCSETLIRRIWEDLFLKATKTTCSVRQDLTC